MKKIFVKRVLKTMVLMLVMAVLNVFFLPTARADFGWEQVVGDGAGIVNGLGDANNESAYSIAVFGNHLYVGTRNYTNCCEVWRSSNGTSWNQVNIDGFGDTDNITASSMAVFDSYLYVGTYNNPDGCEVWRSINGTDWNQVNTNGFGDANNRVAFSMAVFGSYLYVGTTTAPGGCEVWRSSDGTIWSPVSTSGFSDIKNATAYCMAVFGSYLYVGTRNDTDGCEVWRSSNGINWNQVNTDGFGDSDNDWVLSMTVFGSYLYVGTWNFADGCEVWRSSNGTDWNQVNTDGFGDPENWGASSMTVFGNYLYVGTYYGLGGSGVWRSSNGTDWNQVNTDGFGDVGNEDSQSMAIFGRYLYVGTVNSPDGCEVWRLPQDSDDDGIKDDEDKCPCHPNGIDKGTCVVDVGNVIMSYEEGDELITCDDDIDCEPDGYCQKVQGDCNGNGIGDVCEGYADFNESGDVNLADLLDLIICYGKTNFETYPDCEQYDTNDDNRVSAWDYLILTLQYGRDGFDTCGAGIAPARVAKTGQKKCYGEVGDEMNCLDTGQDGEYQEGVTGPRPRFTDNADGTITDNLTGLIWLKNANCFLERTWSQALSDCSGLASGQCALTDGSSSGDWRLPNRDELNNLMHANYYNPALPDTEGTGQWTNGDPFNNVQFNSYWSSTTNAENTADAWYLHFYGGGVYYQDKDLNGFVLAVRGGHPNGVDWPVPRFADNGDGTITDNLTGLVWLKNANCFGTRTWDEALTDCNGLASVQCGLTDGSIAGEWRLPNRNELYSLTDAQYFIPALPNMEGTGQWAEGDPFNNVNTSYYWSSTTHADVTDNAWYVHFYSGGVYYQVKSTSSYVLPVRSGN
jgi:hypothetical protein